MLRFRLLQVCQPNLVSGCRRMRHLHRLSNLNFSVNSICADFTQLYPCSIWQGLDLSRFSAAPSARLSHFPFESDGAFSAQC
jgi:hypothetical protein